MLNVKQQNYPTQLYRTNQHNQSFICPEAHYQGQWHQKSHAKLEELKEEQILSLRTQIIIKKPESEAHEAKPSSEAVRDLSF